MKLTLFSLLLLSLMAYAQDKEGDLQLPVSDLPNVQREEEKIPTIDEVPMYEKKKSEEKLKATSKDKNTKQSN